MQWLSGGCTHALVEEVSMPNPVPNFQRSLGITENLLHAIGKKKAWANQKKTSDLVAQLASVLRSCMGRSEDAYILLPPIDIKTVTEAGHYCHPELLLNTQEEEGKVVDRLIQQLDDIVQHAKKISDHPADTRDLTHSFITHNGNEHYFYISFTFESDKLKAVSYYEPLYDQASEPVKKIKNILEKAIKHLDKADDYLGVEVTANEDQENILQDNGQKMGNHFCLDFSIRQALQDHGNSKNPRQDIINGLLKKIQDQIEIPLFQSLYGYCEASDQEKMVTSIVNILSYIDSSVTRHFIPNEVNTLLTSFNQLEGNQGALKIFNDAALHKINNILGDPDVQCDNQENLLLKVTQEIEARAQVQAQRQARRLKLNTFYEHYHRQDKIENSVTYSGDQKITNDQDLGHQKLETLIYEEASEIKSWQETFDFEMAKAVQEEFNKADTENLHDNVHDLDQNQEEVSIFNRARVRAFFNTYHPTQHRTPKKESTETDTPACGG